MEWNISRMEWKEIFHTSFRALYLQKNIYECRGVTNNIITEVFTFNSYWYYLLTNRSSLVVYIAEVATDPNRTRILLFFLGPGSSFIRRCGSGSDFADYFQTHC